MESKRITSFENRTVDVDSLLYLCLQISVIILLNAETYKREKIESLNRFAIDDTAEMMVRNYLQMKDNSNPEDPIENRIQF